MNTHRHQPKITFGNAPSAPALCLYVKTPEIPPCRHRKPGVEHANPSTIAVVDFNVDAESSSANPKASIKPT